MDSSPVNWEALDTLVIEFAKSENLIEDSSTPSSLSPPSSPSLSPPTPCSASCSSYHTRLLIRQIRRSLESGDIDSALDLLHIHAPSTLSDHRLLFRLQKQKFVELLRGGKADDRDKAIDCLRTTLAPCALDAYPEAYEEFKHVLLALIYDKDDHSSPVADEGHNLGWLDTVKSSHKHSGAFLEYLCNAKDHRTLKQSSSTFSSLFSLAARLWFQWSESRRSEIAGLMSSILRAQLRAHDPLFSMALRYLISIHKEYCFREGIASPISDLSERLLLVDKDPPATPQESMYEVPPFDEVDIQALAHAVQLTRQGAVDSLRFAKGDLFQAFQNELCRFRLNVSFLDQLVHEYCVYRGIVDPVVRPTSGCKVEPEVSRPMNSNILTDLADNEALETESSIGNAHMDGSVITTNMVSTQDADVEVRLSCETTSKHEDCSTSTYHSPKTFRAQRNRTYAHGERMRRKRWRGRNDDMDFMVDDRSNNHESMEVSAKVCPLDDKYDIILGIKELASGGMAAEVVEELNAMDPEFFGQNSLLMFQLKQVEFLKLVKSGDYNRALAIACAHLGPLAADDPALLRALKETLLALLMPNEDVLKKEWPLHALASSLQVAMSRRLGIEEPQLMKVMRATIDTHTAWFKLQMCKDRFESFLKIDFLKDTGAPFLLGTVSRPNAESQGQSSSQDTVSFGSKMVDGVNSPSQESSTDTWDENAILKVMEFLALPRADAIHLLAQYNGNAETVIQQIFA